MNFSELKYLETLTGARWTGMRFFDRGCAAPRRCSTLCEAIAQSFKESFSLQACEMECPGALRCLGFEGNDEKMVAHISTEAGAAPQSIRAIIAAAPRMEKAVRTVGLGPMADPELCVGYVSPEAAMKLLRNWQIQHGSGLFADLSSFMAVCSAVVAAIKNDTLVFSLGCPESRKKGGIAPDRLVAILPRRLVHTLMEGIPVCRHMNMNAKPAVSGLNDFSI
ncbi:MAG: DUF169 domain-containing protein [Deltaproteobacteria bacterium]|nr:DUF169 domain-containing protein [Deltaproteobacteria bacterium]